jgi:hypothetical protein
MSVYVHVHFKQTQGTTNLFTNLYCKDDEQAKKIVQKIIEAQGQMASSKIIVETEAGIAYIESSHVLFANIVKS